MDEVDQARFFSKVDKTSSPNGCWIWTAGTNNKGYGKFKYSGVWYLTHRISWEIHKGPIPDDLLVLHKCHNRKCVNPNHLKLGTYQDNSDDMVLADRQAKGEDNGRAKLTQEDVEIIRHLYDNNDRFQMSQHDIARSFEICQNQVFLIIRRKNWSHI